MRELSFVIEDGNAVPGNVENRDIAVLKHQVNGRFAEYKYLRNCCKGSTCL
jgi:hypothetical protein